MQLSITTVQATHGFQRDALFNINYQIQLHDKNERISHYKPCVLTYYCICQT